MRLAHGLATATVPETTMRRLDLALRFARGGVNLVVGLLIVFLVFPLVRATVRHALIEWWAGAMLRICRIALRVSGAPVEGGSMLLCNHISWLDIYVIDAVRATRFVAKSEIRRWPLFGILAARTGTLFIERGRRRAVHQIIRIAAGILRQGGRIGVFPEGTTGDGGSVLPFHANLIQAALDAGVPVQPVCLSYRYADGSLCGAAAFVGELTVVESMCATLLAAPLTAHVDFLAPIATSGRTRHEIAALARAAIAHSLPGLGPGFRPAPDIAGNPLGTPLCPRDEPR